jgi:hypothetical protein
MTTPKHFVGIDLPFTRTLTSHGNCSSMVPAFGLARPQSLTLKFSSPVKTEKISNHFCICKYSAVEFCELQFNFFLLKRYYSV